MIYASESQPLTSYFLKKNPLQDDKPFDDSENPEKSIPFREEKKRGKAKEDEVKNHLLFLFMVFYIIQWKKFCHFLKPKLSS